MRSYKYEKKNTSQCRVVQFLNADILVRFLNELFKVFVLSFLYFNLLLQGDYFCFQLFLLSLHGFPCLEHIKQPFFQLADLCLDVAEQTVCGLCEIKGEVIL